MHLNPWKFWALITPVALSIGMVSTAVMLRLTQPPEAPIRGCEDCGAQLSKADGTHCWQCVGRKRANLNAESGCIQNFHAKEPHQ